MQRMFDRFFGRMSAFPSFPATTGLEMFGGYPACSVSDDGEAVVVRAEVPGLDADDIDINVEGNILTLKGEKREERKEEKENFFCMERSFGSFIRRIELPSNVDTNRADARLDRGVLTLTLPKIAGEAARTIKVQPGSSAS
jgi:HSP20 family protein